MKLSNLKLVNEIVDHIELCKTFKQYDLEFCSNSAYKFKSEVEIDVDRQEIMIYYDAKIKELNEQLELLGVEVDC